MPLWAVRMRTRVLSVHPERVSAIDDAGAVEEGFKDRAEFVAAWNAIYPHATVALDPWVWVIHFELE